MGLQFLADCDPRGPRTDHGMVFSRVIEQAPDNNKNSRTTMIG